MLEEEDVGGCTSAGGCAGEGWWCRKEAAALVVDEGEAGGVCCWIARLMPRLNDG